MVLLPGLAREGREGRESVQVVPVLGQAEVVQLLAAVQQQFLATLLPLQAAEHLAQAEALCQEAALA